MSKFIPEIEDSFKKMDKYPLVTERYFQPFYFVPENGSSQEHLCVLLHSNKICLITLAPTHPIIKNKKTVVKLDFQITQKIHRLENTVRGKGKKGAQQIKPDSILCHVYCDDGTKYSILGCVKGKLLEINQLLLKTPNLIAQKPSSKGFIAIILPCLKSLDIQKKNLLSCEKYMSMVVKQKIT